jgi:5'-nucleotidase
MRLLLDLDGVLVEMLPSLLERYNQDYQDNVSIDQLDSWGLHRHVRPECGKKIYRYLLESGFYRNLPPVQGGPETVRQLHEEGYEIYVVTAAPLLSPTAIWDKQEWIRHYLPFLMEGSPRVVFTHHKYLIQGDLLLDDSPENLDRFPQLSVAMDAPYNQGHGDHRVGSWPEFYRWLQQYNPAQPPAPGTSP